MLIKKDLLEDIPKALYSGGLYIKYDMNGSNAKFKYNLDNYDKVISLDNKNFLVLKNNHLFIPEDKWYISNEIIVKLLEGVKYE